MKQYAILCNGKPTLHHTPRKDTADMIVQALSCRNPRATYTISAKTEDWKCMSTKK